MRRSRVAMSATLSVVLLMAAPAVVATDYFLKIDGIEGESAADSAPAIIEVASVSWGASKRIVAGDGAAAAPALDAVNELVLLTRESPSRPSPSRPVTKGGVARMCGDGNPVRSGVLTADGKRYRLKDVIVTSCTVKGGQREIRLKGHVTLIK